MRLKVIDETQLSAKLPEEGALSPAEAELLASCELLIAAGLQTFYEVGCALLEIRDARLYRSEFATFEEYCHKRWDFTPQHAGRLIRAVNVVNLLEPMGSIPTTERQARELAPLDAEAQKAVWQIAVATAPVSDQGRPLVTAAHIKSVVEVLTDVVRSGGLDDGEGEMKPLGTLIDAAITETTYERMMRQKEHIKSSREFRDKQAEERKLQKSLDGLASIANTTLAERCQLLCGDFREVMQDIEANRNVLV